jgi:hypothetical protein
MKRKRPHDEVGGLSLDPADWGLELQMTKQEVLAMIEAYETHACPVEEDALHGIRARFPQDGSEAKAMRWLGFCQGVLHERGIFTLDELKQHSLSRVAPHALPRL